MNKELEIIESYFTGKLSNEEKKSFEKRIETDIEFAETVSFYTLTRNAFKNELYFQKKKDFNQLYEELSTSNKNKKGIIKALVPYIGMAAAACFLIFFIWNSFSTHPTPERLASNYIEENLQNLSVTMGGTEDTLQLGINAYNSEAYGQAEAFFLSITDDENLRSEAVKYLGLTYLKTEDYNKAIEQFDFLSNFPNLYANPGPFYKALVLMKRSEGNDVAEAKRILREIIENDLSGMRHAEMWMEILED